MAQIFHRSTNTIARVSIYGAALIAFSAVYLLYIFAGSPYITEVNVAKVQPVPFSHRHHAGELGIDCRYCHTAVEEFVRRRHPADADVHDVPFADLDRKPHARAGARQLSRRSIDPVGACESDPGLCLFQSQHSHQ